MTKTLTAAGYMIQDIHGNAIFGIGETADEAWAMVVDGVGTFFDRVGEEISSDEARENQFKTYSATEALINQVKSHGGDIAWGKIGGVACTIEEQEAE